MGLITPEIRKTAQDAIDSLMAPTEEGGLGKHCSLIFEPRKTRCPNCFWDSQNARSANRPKGGGPQPFPAGGLCPVCNGKGTLDTEVTEDIVLLLNWNPRTWAPMPGVSPSNANLELPGGMFQAKGYLSRLPHVLKSRKILVESQAAAYIRYVYVLDGEPIDAGSIIQGRYFLSLWKRAGT